MPPRRSHAPSRVTPKGTVNRSAAAPSAPTSPRQRAVAARRQADQGFHGVRSSQRPPVAFRRSGHR